MTEEMKDDSDWKPCVISNPEFKCPKCSSKQVRYRTHECGDGAYTDYQYHCGSCGKKWWVEGSDY